MIDMVSLLSSADEFGVFSGFIATPGFLKALPGTDVELTSQERKTQATIALNLALLCPVAPGTRQIKNIIHHPRVDRYYFGSVTIALTGGQSTELNYKSNFSFTQISGQNSQFRSNISSTRESRVLSNPYKLVYVCGELTTDIEHLMLIYHYHKWMQRYIWFTGIHGQFEY